MATEAPKMIDFRMVADTSLLSFEHATHAERLGYLNEEQAARHLAQLKCNVADGSERLQAILSSRC